MDEAIRRWCVEMLSYGKRPTQGRCDAGSVETGHSFQLAMAALELRIIPAPPRKQNQNPVERTVQIIGNDLAVALTNAPIPMRPNKWLRAAQHVSTIRNNTANSITAEFAPGKTPEEIMTGRRTDSAGPRWASAGNRSAGSRWASAGSRSAGPRWASAGSLIKR